MLIPRRINGRIIGERNPETECFIDVTPTLPISVEAVEAKYKAEYVCETEVVYRNGEPQNIRGLVFWQPVKYPGGSNYFVLYFAHDGTTLVINDALPIVKTPITGVVADNKEIVFSRFRHDARSSADGSVWIDGGRSYTHSPVYPEDRFVTLKIEEYNLILQ